MATTPRTPSTPDTPLEDTNPPGPAEGVEQASGPPEAHDTPVGLEATQPSAAEVGSTTVTTDEDRDPTPAQDPVAHLHAYLTTHHPEEARMDAHPATTAVRLLTRLGAKGDTQARCAAPYCNLPAHHGGEHGWVHVEP